MTERPAFEVGQIWRSRANGMFEIVPQLDYGLGGDDDPYPISARALDGSETITTTKYGRVYEDPEAIDDNDLIELVSEATPAESPAPQPAAPSLTVGSPDAALKTEGVSNISITNCHIGPVQTPAVNLRLEALKLAVQAHTTMNIEEGIRETAVIFLAFIDPPPPAEDELED